VAPRGRIILVSQPFVPDPASVGQHMTDVARELVRRGYDVRVVTSERGYDDPNVRYPRREVLDGIDIRRIRFASFGKKNLVIRALGAMSFQLQALWHQLATPGVDGILFSTTPPMVGVTAALAGALRRVPIAYWAMDLNPDQLIMMGKLEEKSLGARALEAANRFILSRASLIVALDRFMQDRLLARGDYAAKMLVMPPWPHEEDMEAVDQATNPFRVAHGLVGKRVIMYSGNHSPSNPLTTLLAAAAAMKDDDRVRFLFVGGGTGKAEVEKFIADHALTNTISLPYQPLADLKYSLSAADVHVVSMGDEMAGIIHPCKIYGAMAVGRPILYLGPRPSHVSDILDAHACGWHVAHGDVEGMKRRLADILTTPAGELARMGEAAQTAMRASLSQAILLGRMADRLEETFAPPGAT
jgi:colanic acid biosynthesis glycosyl transferase WcaI